MFTVESSFEDALVKLLSENGWEDKVLSYCTEKELLKNWAQILFENNRGIDRLNDYPLTEGEMGQILEQIQELKTPLRLNGFINGGTVEIIRDNESDKQHFGKVVSLKIYDRKEIAAGQSRYQIVRQPRFLKNSPVVNECRGDLMLMINGMPVIHIELKRSGVPLSQACYQIEKYARRGVFSGLFSLVQIFVAMSPEEAVYFANPGPGGTFNPDFFFHWADFNNEPINEWKQVTSTLLSIPMAHQLIGFYTVADDLDGVLKVMRSYQYYAASAISDRVAKAKWDGKSQLGGFVWHTTGSGKTMTSFKSAQLIASSKDADKVVFLMDRIELGTQSLIQFRGFANACQSIQATENTQILIGRLKSSDPSDTLIVTSIQKMSNIKDDEGFNASDLEQMKSKRIVFIVDECHRSTFGEMLYTIKQTFPNAIFFGFTGTPIQEENRKHLNTTSSIFGDELHRYSIADGIRDKNVLGFDPYKILTYRDGDLRNAVALEKARSKSLKEVLADREKKEVYYKYYNLPMVGRKNENGVYEKGIEDYIPAEQYNSASHRKMVLRDILENWPVLSHEGKFHAILATNSILEAIEYYSLFKKEAPSLKVTALFDPNIDNNQGGEFKEQGLIDIISDYNERYGQHFSFSNFQEMKKDIATRLSHKKQYERIDGDPGSRIDILIVVDQMLTGFDSKWINALYLDKLLRYENIIQAFSRTNRLFGPEKPFGTIRYYRKPHTMEVRIKEAVKLYSGNRPLALFVDRLDKNLEGMNSCFDEIESVFHGANLKDFSKLPSDMASRKKFASLFKSFNDLLEAAKVQGFSWKKTSYVFTDETHSQETVIDVTLNETTYLTLALRYKELFSGKMVVEGSLPYEVSSYLTAINTESINDEYMNSRYEKYCKLLNLDEKDQKELDAAESELHRTFATLTQEQQKFADIFLHDIQRGDVKPEAGKTLKDYISEYMMKAKDDRVHQFAASLGVNEGLLRDMMARNLAGGINQFGRFDALKASIDMGKAKAYLEEKEGRKISLPKVRQKTEKMLRDFLSGD